MGLVGCHPAATPPGAKADGSVAWLGGPTAIVAHGGIRIITDPMLGPRGPDAFVLPKHPSTGAPNAHFARYTATPTASLDGLDAIIVSHTHNDHVDGRAKELLAKSLPVIVPPTGVEPMRSAGFADVRPLDWGESATFDGRGTTLVVTAVPAHHAHDPELDRTIGRVNGYVLRFGGAGGPYRIYWTGDAVLSDEMKTLASTYGPIDLLLPHLGGVGGDGDLGLRTMTSQEAVALVGLVDPKVVIPIHHTTFAHYREPIEALVQRADEAGLGARFRFPVEGAPIPLP
jgi:L-ascorbate metabolism protein UlaG (beta-lactamase superfamily)